MTTQPEALVESLRHTLWVLAEHNALHFGESHSTVIQARQALAALVKAQQPAPSAAAAPEGGPPGSGGWQKHAIEMERQRDYYRQRCHTMEEHQNGGVWYWQGDDGDNLESMGNSMLVVIRADQLRSLRQPSPTPQADPLQRVVDLQEQVGMYADDFAPQADSAPAPVLDYPPLPEPKGKIEFPAQPYEDAWVSSMDAYDGEQMRAYVDADRAARTPADSVTAPAGGVDDAVDAIALARYKVVPAHESMFHRFAVVAGDGKQQLYLGREIECANMARKFAGAFLDGAFYQANIAPTPPAQAADSVLEDAALDSDVVDRIVLEHIGKISSLGEGNPVAKLNYYRDLVRAGFDAARKQGGE